MERFVAQAVLIVEIADKFERVLPDKPIAVAAILPFGEVDRTDRPAGELGFENGTDLGQSIEPGEDGFCLVAVAKAVVKLFANFVGEASDFTGASHKGGLKFCNIG